MRNFFCFVLIFFSFSARAHEYHFAFAEAAYNNETQTIQATISFSTRDFQHSLEHEGMSVQPLEKYQDDKMMQLLLADKLLEHFKISVGELQCAFDYVGFEVMNNGTTHFYFESQKLALSSDLTILFDLLMYDNPKQQNKLNFIHLTKKKSIEFLPNQSTQIIKLESIIE